MQEEVTQKTIALVIKTAKLDANVLKAAMRMYLNHRRQKAQKTHGKTSVKKLVGEGVGVSSIEVTDGNIKSFERVARKYNVDFAVKKDKTTDPPEYVVFFKGRDADAVAQAFKEFVYGNEKRNDGIDMDDEPQAPKSEKEVADRPAKNIPIAEKAVGTEQDKGIRQYADAPAERVSLKAKLEVMKAKVAGVDTEKPMSQKVKGKEETL